MEKVLKKSKKKSEKILIRLSDAETGWGGFLWPIFIGGGVWWFLCPLGSTTDSTVLKGKEVCQNPCIFLFTESDKISERNVDSNCNRCGKLKTGSRDMFIDHRYSLCVPLRYVQFCIKSCSNFSALKIFFGGDDIAFHLVAIPTICSSRRFASRSFFVYTFTTHKVSLVKITTICHLHPSHQFVIVMCRVLWT